jgi:hypothetical protein
MWIIRLSPCGLHGLRGTSLAIRRWVSACLPALAGAALVWLTGKLTREMVEAVCPGFGGARRCRGSSLFSVASLADRTTRGNL